MARAELLEDMWLEAEAKAHNTLRDVEWKDFSANPEWIVITLLVQKVASLLETVEELETRLREIENDR